MNKVYYLCAALFVTFLGLGVTSLAKEEGFNTYGAEGKYRLFQTFFFQLTVLAFLMFMCMHIVKHHSHTEKKK